MFLKAKKNIGFGHKKCGHWKKAYKDAYISIFTKIRDCSEQGCRFIFDGLGQAFSRPREYAYLLAKAVFLLPTIANSAL